MSAITLFSLATAVPPMHETQADAFHYMKEHFDLPAAQEDLYRRLMLEGPIEGRYFGMDCREDSLIDDPDALNERFLKHGRLVIKDAASQVLEAVDLSPDNVRGLVVNTCTGYLCPGFSSYLCGDLGLKDNVHILDVMGMGCGGAIPNLRSGVGLIRSGLGQPVMGVAVEICSSTLFMDDDPALTVSNAIFGDGAAAFLLHETPEPAPGEVELIDFETVIDPKRRELLRYRQEQGRLRNQLSSKVPVAGARLAERAVQRLLGRHGISAEQIQHWMVHAGGTSVLDQVCRQMDLSEDILQSSYTVFRKYGNISSPSVLFVLAEELKTRTPDSDSLGLLLSFGAGFTAFACLIRFR